MALHGPTADLPRAYEPSVHGLGLMTALLAALLWGRLLMYLMALDGTGPLVRMILAMILEVRRGRNFLGVLLFTFVEGNKCAKLDLLQGCD